MYPFVQPFTLAFAADYYGPAPGISAFIATRFTAIFAS
jgi:hypothetical protein